MSVAEEERAGTDSVTATKVSLQHWKLQWRTYLVLQPDLPLLSTLKHEKVEDEAKLSRASTIHAASSPPAPPPSSGGRSLVVKNLPPQANEENLFHLFEEFGPTAGFRVNYSININITT